MEPPVLVTRRARPLLAPALLLIVALGCSSGLDCSSLSCAAPTVLVNTAKTYPTGSLAELCGQLSQCLIVPVGVPTQDPAGVPLTAEPVLDKRWLRKDIMRGATNVRILSPQGEVLAEGAGLVEWAHECCASSEVLFEG